MNRTHLRRGFAALLAASLVVAGCGDDDTDIDAASTTTTTTTTDTTTTTTTTTTELDASQTEDDTGEEAASDDSDLVIDVTVAGGEVSGGGRHDVSVGDRVTLVITSDVADHVHLHGYDVMVDVAPGEPAELTFDATISGVFEVELEDSGLPLLELEIS